MTINIDNQGKLHEAIRCDWIPPHSQISLLESIPLLAIAGIRGDKG
jgi:hypothetical protein